MLVSVVVPVFNHERYLTECLASISNQTWPHIELIVLDDCSTDGSFAMAQEFVAKADTRKRFSRVVVARNAANIGAANTINKAIRSSAGDAIMLINSDDYYAPSRFERCLQEIRAGHDFVFTDVEFVGERGEARFEADMWRFRSALDDAAKYPSTSAAFIQANRAISTGNFCFTRKLFDAVGPFRDLKYCHDWDFALGASLRTEPAYITEKLYYYRLHRANSYRSLSMVAESDTRDCYQRYFNAVARLEMTNPRLAQIAGCGTLWSRLIKRAGPIAVQEWQGALSGIALPRVESKVPEPPAPGKAAAEPALGLTPSPAVSLLAALSARVRLPLELLRHGGAVYGDGWIGAHAWLQIKVPEAARGLALVCFVPAKLGSRKLTVSVTHRSKSVRRTSISIEPGKKSRLVFADLPVGPAVFLVKFSVKGASRTAEDRRPLGVLLGEIVVE